MWRAAKAGVPVPTVYAVSGPTIRMERVDGPTLASYLAEHPKQVRPSAQVLATLHHALDGTFSAGASLLHGDLHPGNVVMGAGGPVLIDWTNHMTGLRALDVAMTWLVLYCFEPGDDQLLARLNPLRHELLGSFLESVDVAAAGAALVEAAVIRHSDPATTATEHARIDQLVARAGAS